MLGGGLYQGTAAAGPRHGFHEQAALPALQAPHQPPSGAGPALSESLPRVAAVIFTLVASHAQRGVEHPSALLRGPRPPPL